jgi:hypothetical protein
MVTEPGITNLEGMVDSLPDEEKTLFRRIYAVNADVGRLRVPQGMRPWVRQQFGPVEDVVSQDIVRVANRITLEETLFNRLRSSRPVRCSERSGLDTRLAAAVSDDLFRKPEESTPEDLFGRVTGKYCITAANVAKYDGLHSVIIFNEFHPLCFSREQIIDYIDVARQWAERAQAVEPRAKYFFFIWNCLWRAGASICHGHAQVMLARERHYAKIEALRRAALGYRQSYGSGYFADLFRAHHSVGCAVEKEGVRVLAHLTPFKDNEIVLMAGELGHSFKERLYEVLACFRDRLGVGSFNLSLVTPPLAETEESWEDFPVMARLVDRGSPDSLASDVGGMEIYASSVVASDPFELARRLREYLSEGASDG